MPEVILDYHYGYIATHSMTSPYKQLSLRIKLHVKGITLKITAKYSFDLLCLTFLYFLLVL